MKKLVKSLIIFLVAGLVISNVYIFVVGIKSAGDIVRLEEKLETLKRDNLDLENKLSYVSSLEYAASRAADLNFETKAIPSYLDNLKYAANR